MLILDYSVIIAVNFTYLLLELREISGNASENIWKIYSRTVKCTLDKK